MKCLSKKNRAFTLMELLIVLFVSSVIIVSSLTLYHSGYFNNLNQRKDIYKINEMDYVLNYIENELSNCKDFKVTNNKILFKKTYYSYFGKKKSNHKITSFKLINYEFVKSNNRVYINRLSRDMFNEKNFGKNLLIDNLDDYSIEYRNNCISIILKYKNKEFKRNFFIGNIMEDNI